LAFIALNNLFVCERTPHPANADEGWIGKNKDIKMITIIEENLFILTIPPCR